MKLLRKRKSFKAFSLTFWYLHEICNILKKMGLIGQLFLELLTSKIGLFKCITGLVSENLLEVNVLPRPKKLLKSAEKYFCLTFSSF